MVQAVRLQTSDHRPQTRTELSYPIPTLALPLEGRAKLCLPLQGGEAVKKCGYHSGPQGWMDWRNFRAEPLGLTSVARSRLITLDYRRRMLPLPSGAPRPKVPTRRPSLRAEAQTFNFFTDSEVGRGMGVSRPFHPSAPQGGHGKFRGNDRLRFELCRPL